MSRATKSAARAAARAHAAGARLPYFDTLLAAVDDPQSELGTAFARHVHWGYWPDPRTATLAADDFAAAAQRLTLEVLQAAEIADGTSVLDVGCGFGGTVAELNERRHGMELVGLNIDDRQLERARLLVSAQNDNDVRFVEGSASQLPFPDASFDTVLAVEAIFHFPDRRKFFAEACRVLKPGGRFALSDFIPSSWMLPGLWMKLFTGYYGPCDMRYSRSAYRRLAAETGLRPTLFRDITAGTMPTYEFLAAQQTKVAVSPTAIRETNALKWAGRLRMMRYGILAFEKPASPAS